MWVKANFLNIKKFDGLKPPSPHHRTPMVNTLTLLSDTANDTYQIKSEKL